MNCRGTSKAKISRHNMCVTQLALCLKELGINYSREPPLENSNERVDLAVNVGVRTYYVLRSRFYHSKPSL